MNPQIVFTFAEGRCLTAADGGRADAADRAGPGLLVSIFQAATQINEATLSFVPKVVAAVAVLAIAGPWMLTTLVEYLQRTLQAIPTAGGL